MDEEQRTGQNQPGLPDSTPKTGDGYGTSLNSPMTPTTEITPINGELQNMRDPQQNDQYEQDSDGSLDEDQQKAVDISEPAEVPFHEPSHEAQSLLSDHENSLDEVRRHPFGILVIYLWALVASLAALSLVFFLAPSLNLSGSTYSLVITTALIMGFVVVFFLFVATYVYRESKLIITDRNVMQILQNGLFNRKVSQLSMSNVEDVTAQQKGFFPTILNFGTLTVETAGEQENFIFPYCPSPNKYAKEILNARERYIEHQPARAYRMNSRRRG